MADEIRLNVSATLTNGNLARSIAPGSISVDQTTQSIFSTVWVVGTSEENLSVSGDITALGYCFMRNLDATNFVTVGMDDSSTMKDFVKLKAGEYALFRLATGITIRGQADTAPVRLQVEIFDD